MVLVAAAERVMDHGSDLSFYPNSFLAAIQGKSLDIIDIFLTFLLSALTLFVLWKQHKLQRVLAQKELFDSRYKIFNGFMTFIDEIMSEDGFDEERMNKFRLDTLETVFFFNENDQIERKKVEVWERARSLLRIREGKEIPSLRSRFAYEVTCNDENTLREQFGEVRNDIEQIFLNIIRIQ